MSDVRLVWRPEGIRGLADSQATANSLGVAAEAVAKRVVVPRHLRVRTRHGIGPHGAFAQVIMRGAGAIAWEFGGLHNPPRAPLRNALRGGR